MQQPHIKILLVDDNKDVYTTTREMLTQTTNKRFVLDWVSTFETALDAIRRKEHQAYLVSYQLGNHDGQELLSTDFF